MSRLTSGPVVITGGGTGGHTSPGLAVAAALAARGIAHAWIGSRTGLEARRAPESGIAYHAIRTGKLRRYWSWQNIVDLALNVPIGIVQAWRLVGRLRPRVVLSTGGFVALPVVLAATARRVPVVVHEQTAVPGLANRIAARRAQTIAVTFAESAPYFPPGRVTVTGNPLRVELREGSRAGAVRHFALEPDVPLVYVTGGAQGARAINRALAGILPDLLAIAQVVHQSGEPDRAMLEERRVALPPALARRYAIRAFVGPELADVYAAAALVVGRAGAGTVNECCHLGVPALYVPLPGASGDEQTANARLVGRAGACSILPQSSMTPEMLLDRIRELLADPARLKQMSERARTLAVPDAAERIVNVVLDA